MVRPKRQLKGTARAFRPRTNAMQQRPLRLNLRAARD